MFKTDLMCCFLIWFKAKKDVDCFRLFGVGVKTSTRATQTREIFIGEKIHLCKKPLISNIIYETLLFHYFYFYHINQWDDMGTSTAQVVQRR